MSKVLFTLPGKIGDNLARLPVAYRFSLENECKVDLYIDKGSIPIYDILKVQDWVREVNICSVDLSYGYGGQPYTMFLTPQMQQEYDKVYHLGFRPGQNINDHFTLCSLRGSETPVKEDGILALQPIKLSHSKIKNLIIHMDAAKQTMRDQAKRTLLPVFKDIPYEKMIVVGVDSRSSFYDEFDDGRLARLDTSRGMGPIVHNMIDSAVFCIDSSVRWLAYDTMTPAMVMYHDNECSFNGQRSSNETTIRDGETDLLRESLKRYYEKG